MALQYSPLQGEQGVDGDLWPRVARYAMGVDYHDLMKHRLEKLADRIRQAFPSCAARSYVDTGPVLDDLVEQVLAMASLVVIPCRPERNDLFAADMTSERQD